MFFIIEEAKEVINRYILNKRKFFKVYKLDFWYYIIVYKDFIYKFRIRVSLLIKKEVVIIIFITYFYSLITYYKNK